MVKGRLGEGIKMILEEEIRNAEQGSIGAMCRIGDYYYQKIRNEGYENEYENMALKYYKMAAEREELYGMYRFIEIGNISAKVELSFAYQIGIQTATKWCEEVYSIAEKTLNFIEKYGSENEEMINRGMVLYQFYMASYYLAICYYFIKSEREAGRLLSRIDKQDIGVQAKLLLALSIFIGENDFSRHQEVYDLLLELENNIEFAETEKMEIEETVYASAALLLSHYCRGNFLNLTPDLDRAVEVLNFVKSHLKREDEKKNIENELRRYHKKLFGGYKYVND